MEFSRRIVTQKSKGGLLRNDAIVRDGRLNIWNPDPEVMKKDHSIQDRRERVILKLTRRLQKLSLSAVLESVRL